MEGRRGEDLWERAELGSVRRETEAVLRFRGTAHMEERGKAEA